MAIKHFNHTHNTVAEVRACTGTPQTVTPEQATRAEISARLLRAHTSSAIMANLTGREYRPITPQAAQRQDAKFARMNRTARPARTAATPAFAARPAHPGRVSFAQRLIGEKDTNMISVAASETLMNVMDGKAVSADEIAELIENLLAAPRKDVKVSPAQRESLRDLAARLPMIDDKGYFAVRAPGIDRSAYAGTLEDASYADDKIHYYRVTRTARGYVKVQAQASDTLYPMSYRASIDAVREILKDAEAARNLYADTLERCYACGRTLTDAESRALRIGPDCRAK